VLLVVESFTSVEIWHAATPSSPWPLADRLKLVVVAQAGPRLPDSKRFRVPTWVHGVK
jgi:hypothetical protein